jgi:histidine triad (HIT) family protein
MDCIFCGIVAGTVPSKKIYEDDLVLAFYDIQPEASIHALIIPKKHIASMNDAGKDDWALIGEVHRAAQLVAQKLGIAETGYRLANCCGEDGGQTVFHLHYHLLGGEKLGPLNLKKEFI